MTMRTLPVLLSATLFLTILPCSPAQDTDAEDQEPKKSKAQERREAKAAEREAKKIARQNKEQDEALDESETYEKVGRGFDFSREFEALNEGAAMLAEVSDEKSAEKVAKKLISKFNLLPIPMGGSEKELELWAKTANKLNRQMERLKTQPWFVSSGLQEAWSMATDPFSRRKAQKGR